MPTCKYCWHWLLFRDLLLILFKDIFRYLRSVLFYHTLLVLSALLVGIQCPKVLQRKGYLKTFILFWVCIKNFVICFLLSVLVKWLLVAYVQICPGNFLLILNILFACYGDLYCAKKCQHRVVHTFWLSRSPRWALQAFSTWPRPSHDLCPLLPDLLPVHLSPVPNLSPHQVLPGIASLFFIRVKVKLVEINPYFPGDMNSMEQSREGHPLHHWPHFLSLLTALLDIPRLARPGASVPSMVPRSCCPPNFGPNTCLDPS